MTLTSGLPRYTLPPGQQFNESRMPSGMYQVSALRGQYVKRDEKAAKTYRVIGYDRHEGKWQLDDTADSSRCIWVKPGTYLYAGFDY